MKPLPRAPITTPHLAGPARGDKLIAEAEGRDDGHSPMAATAATKPEPAPNVTRVSELPAAPIAHIPDHQDPGEETPSEKRKRKRKADARRLAMRRRRGGTGL